MAIPFLQHIDLNKNELQNTVVQNLGTAPGTPKEGQIYFDSTVGDKKMYYHNGSAWVSMSGDIDAVTVNAGEGLEVEAGSASTTSGAFSVTLGLQAAVAGNGLSYSSGVLAVGVDNTTIELDSDAIRVKDNSITIGKLAHRTASHVLKMDGSGVPTSGTIDTANISGDAVTGDKIADNAIDSEHYADASVDNVHLANDGITIGTADTSLGGTVTALVGLTDLDLTAGNKTIFDTVGANTLTMGASDTTIKIEGNLIVTGDTTYHNETIQVVENNTISFEGATADAHEIHLTSVDATADRTITLPDTTGTVALTSDIGNGTITIAAGNALTTGGTFTTNASGNSTITLHHEDTSSQASVDNSGRTYIQDITLDTYGHVTSLTSATETVTDTNTQLATASAEIDVSAMAGNNVASFTHGLTSRNLIVQLYDKDSGLVVHADIDHTSTDAIAITFGNTGTELVTAGIGDIRVVVIDAVHGLTDKTVTYS